MLRIGQCLRRFSGADRCTITLFLGENIFDKYKNTLHVLFPQRVRQMVYLNQVILSMGGEKHTGWKMNDIISNDSKCAHFWKCKARRNFLVPLGFRVFWNNKQVHFQKSFSVKAEVGWQGVVPAQTRWGTANLGAALVFLYFLPTLLPLCLTAFWNRKVKGYLLKDYKKKKPF